MYSFPNKSEFGEAAQPDLRRYNGRLILYGAGKVAEVVDYVLRQRGVEYLCFCDTYRAGGTHCGHPVISPEELERDYSGVPVLVTTIHHRSVVEQLEAYGPREVLDSVPLLVEVDISDWGKGGEQMTEEWAARLTSSYLIAMRSVYNPLFFESLCVQITQKCNLNCLDCSALIPYFRTPKHYDPDVILESFNSLMRCDGLAFRDIYLLGGEPLLYPHLKRLLDMVLSASEGAGAGVSIITNGTHLPDGDMIPLMQNPRFFLRISDYGALSVKKEPLIELLEKNQIRYEVDNYTQWYANRTVLSDPCGEEEASKKYRLCTDAKCLILAERRLFSCCQALQLCKLNVFQENSENSVECFTAEDAQERLRTEIQRLVQCEHLDICHRCHGFPHTHPEHMVPPAIQAPGPLHFA